MVLVITMAAGCGAPRRAVVVRTECAPTNLVVKSNNRGMFLRWDSNCPENTVLSGYYIYLEEKPLYDKYAYRNVPRSVKPLNESVYPGDTDPEDSFETMKIDNLDNGVEYFVSVRTVYPDNSISVSSNEVGVVCRPEGEFDLAFRFSDLNDGFSFISGTAVRADGEENDLYFYHKDGFDFIASPHRLNGFLRKSKFYSLGKTKDIYQYPELDLDIPPVEKMPVIDGESYLIHTADNRYVKIRIERVWGEKKERKLRIKYIYQTAEGLMRF